MITIEHENTEELRKWGWGIWRLIEKCYFCDEPTRYWQTQSNTPVCESCAKVRTIQEIKK